MAKFYLGTHMPHWLEIVDIPLFVSHRRLAGRKSFPKANVGWALDSGGFTELHEYGGWATSVHEYVEAVIRYQEEIGLLEWVAPMDWMCEPSARKRTGSTVFEHQVNTVENFLELRDELGDLVVPVLQGWDRSDYHQCLDLYEDVGVDLTQEARVGLGSVCRRDAASEIANIIADMQPINLHAFGIKGTAWQLTYDRLASADSMAWSLRGRHVHNPRHSHKSCANCLEFALSWYAKTTRQAAPKLPFQDAA